MIRRESKKQIFVVALLLFIFSITLQFKLHGFLNFHPDLALTTLVVLAFFLDFLPTLFFTLLGVFILNWQPTISLELVVFVIIPLTVYWISKFLPGRLWFSVLIFSAIAVPTFYAIINFGAFYTAPLLLLGDVLVCLIFASLDFYLLEAFSKKN